MPSTPYCDFDASVAKLSGRVRQMRESDWSPTPRVRELEKFARHLEKTADLMWEPRWLEIQDAFDANPKPDIGLDGYPVEQESRLGSYSAVQWELRDIADLARKEAESYPDSRARPEIPYAAEVFLHIWYQAEKDYPSKYENGEAVLALDKVYRDAGIFLSKVSVKNALSKALNEFDATSWPPGLDNIIVSNQ